MTRRLATSDERRGDERGEEATSDKQRGDEEGATGNGTNKRREQGEGGQQIILASEVTAVLSGGASNISL